MATKKLYRSKHGEVFGVCQGIADWRDLPVGPVRLIVLLAIVFTGIFPGVAIYLLAALVIPANPYESDRPSDGRRSDWDWHRMGHRSRHTGETVHGTYENDADDARSTDELKEEYERLKKKVEKMEEEMFDKERDWDQRFHEGS
ncbi:MAG: PspC domain-containing protein [Sphaerochaetaceae bacterium]|jgi:phage shock protein C